MAYPPRSASELSTLSLSPERLKHWVHKPGVNKTDQLLMMLATFDAPVSLTALLGRGEAAGVRKQSFSNPSASLAKAKGLAIRVLDGWEITEAGRQRLLNLGVSDAGAGVINVARDIRQHALQIRNGQTREYLDEAIRCFELGLYRSAVVMTWLAAVYVLQSNVVARSLEDFNREAVRVDPKWKAAITIDDIGRMKEVDLLDRLVAISIIGKNVKSALRSCLDLRNACGHPNSMKIGVNSVAAHIETLLLNVFVPFSK